MPILQKAVDDSTYAELDWLSLAGELQERHTPWNRAKRFLDRAAKLEEVDEPVRAQAMRVLGGAIFMHLSEPLHIPFSPAVRTNEGRSMAIEDLGEHDIALLARAARDAPDPWLRARFADLAVTAKGDTPPDWRLGQLAAEGYIDYVMSVFGTEMAIDGLAEIRRGLVLLRVYARRNEALWDRYWNAIATEVAHASEKGWLGLAAPLCDEALARNPQACEAFVPHVDAKARSLEGPNPQEAARWHALSHRLHHRLRHREEAVASLMAQGEALVRAAELSGDRQAMLAVMHLTEAIGVLRRARAAPSRIRELRDQLAIYERASLDSFVRHEARTDISDIVRWVDEQVTGPDFFSALLQMAHRLAPWLDINKIEERVRANARRFFFSSLFAPIRVDSSGKTVSRGPALDVNDPESVRHHMIEDARKFDLSMRAQVIIPRAADLVFTTYQPSFQVIREIVVVSPIPPQEHAETLARGLYAGFVDDWLATSAYLIPVMEPFVRHLLRRAGAHTTALNEDGTQHEKTLGELFDMQEAEQILGKNLIFELRVLLIEPEGFNLRNSYCHGLLTDREAHNAGIICLWWTIWRMILLPWHDHPSLLITGESSNPETPMTPT